MKATLFAIAAILAAPSAAAQVMYKCVQPNGRVVYQDSTCDDKAKQSTVRGADAAPTRALPPGDERLDAPAELDVGTIVNIMSGYHGCAQEVPGFATKHTGTFNNWRLRNVASLNRYARDEAAQQKVRDSMQEQLRTASTDPQARADRAEACEKEIAGWFTPPKPKT